MSKIEVKVVIGSNYGDEGKGLATRYFSQQSIQNGNPCLNILYNGGCQRGHTVELKNGLRHVFHHFGSGSFDYADTYFDRDFIVNPMVFVKEYNELLPIVNIPCHAVMIYISPYCRVSTPYDMMINQIIETARWNERHGSCGCGIWETQQRYINSEYALCFGDLVELSDEEIVCYLHDIATKYLPKCLENYGITIIPREYQELINSDGLIQHYLSDIRTMQSLVIPISQDCIIPRYSYVVFEGAQGLELDEDNESAYPNVTASKTTSLTPAQRVKNFDCNVEICYVTRSYFTRHGAGKFPTECKKEVINPDIEDVTNIYNEFQQNIRYGKFDVGEFLSRVKRDMLDSKKIIPKAGTSLLVTHLNYTNGLVGNTTAGKLSEYFDKTYTSSTKFAEDIQLQYKKGRLQ